MIELGALSWMITRVFDVLEAGKVYSILLVSKTVSYAKILSCPWREFPLIEGYQVVKTYLSELRTILLTRNSRLRNFLLIENRVYSHAMLLNAGGSEGSGRFQVLLQQHYLAKGAIDYCSSVPP